MGRLKPREIVAEHARGGFAFTRMVDQPLGAMVTSLGIRRGWSPTSLTLASLTTAVATSVGVAVLGRGLGAAVLALVGWQLAYVFDCADGQLARATGRTSDAGAVLDLYADLGGKVAVVAALLAVTPGLSPVLAVLVTAGMSVGTFHEAANRHGPVGGRHHDAIRVIEVARDWGLHVLVLACSLVLPPLTTVAGLGALAALGWGQYGVRLMRLAAASNRLTGPR